MTMTAKIVAVEWVDSACDASWRSLDKAVADAEATWDRKHLTVGFLLCDTDDFVLVASSYAEQDGSASEHVADTMMIPKACVLAIEPLPPKPAESDPRTDA